MLKNADHSVTNIFTIKAIGESVTMVQACAYNGKPMTIKVEMITLLSRWSVSNAQTPIMMEGVQRRSQAIDVDLCKMQLFKAISDADSMSAAARSLVFWRRPDEVRTSVKISKGQVVSAPVVHMLGITTQASHVAVALGKHEVNDSSMHFYAVPPPKPHSKPDVPSEFDDGFTLAAYWWVLTTPSKTEANMEVDHITKNGIDVPILRSRIDLEPFVKLTRFKAKEDTQPLKGVSVLIGSMPDARKRKR